MNEKAIRLAKIRRVLLFTAFSLALVLFALDRYAAFAHVPAADSTRVVIYTTQWCPYCKRLRADLAASHVPYTEIDVERAFQGQLGFWALRGRGVPVSAIGPKIVYGYRVDEIAQALSAIGYTFASSTGEKPPGSDGAPAISPTKRLGLSI
jgi:mycoredoxin